MFSKTFEKLWMKDFHIYDDILTPSNEQLYETLHQVSGHTSF